MLISSFNTQICVPLLTFCLHILIVPMIDKSIISLLKTGTFNLQKFQTQSKVTHSRLYDEVIW